MAWPDRAHVGGRGRPRATVQALIEHGADRARPLEQGIHPAPVRRSPGSIGAARDLLRGGAKVTDALPEESFALRAPR